ncbi:g1867 [Coccomyxa elongata]
MTAQANFRDAGLRELPYRRSIPPPFSRGLDINGTKVFHFLFPDGNILSAHWTSYAILAIVLALAVELSTRLLMLLSREPPTPEELSKLEMKAMKAEAQEAAEDQRYQAQLEAKRQMRLLERIAEIRQKRLQDARAAKRRSSASSTWNPSSNAKETVPSQEELEVEKYIFRDFIVEERYRGLKWLFIATLGAIWVTGVLNKDSPLAP